MFATKHVCIRWFWPDSFSFELIGVEIVAVVGRTRGKLPGVRISSPERILDARTRMRGGCSSTPSGPRPCFLLNGGNRLEHFLYRKR